MAVFVVEDSLNLKDRLLGASISRMGPLCFEKQHFSRSVILVSTGDLCTHQRCIFSALTRYAESDYAQRSIIILGDGAAIAFTLILHIKALKYSSPMHEVLYYHSSLYYES